MSSTSAPVNHLNEGGQRSSFFSREGMTKLTHAIALLVVVVAVSIPVVGIVVTPLDLTWQTYNAIGMIIAALLLSRIRRKSWALALVILSVIASSRYMYWRVTNTLPLGDEHSAFDLFLASGLLAAEIYAYIILMLGFLQTVWPLKRKPVPLPLDYRTWPTVDIFIPTYNEPLEVVRSTILASKDVDWPRDKLRVYVLDDGRRQDFQEYCAEHDVGYLTREDNAHAKAGNINEALKKTQGEFVAVFDCDHVPTRSFLQMTMGVLVRDSRMALVQTPHHFFSPDPFERNLRTFKDVPNEGELFYGLVQDGNDFWNATFFCGSCAVIRRSALEEIGGIAVETVTEDAHTSLKLHAKGWHSAYLNLPQAAGLATESLGAHVGQRIRWARGMAQIFRSDNPLIKPGLSLGQRLCYTNAMLHFFNALPRIVFLTSPLAYLLLGAEIIAAQGVMMLAYAAPHLVIAMVANSRIQGEHRQSFWSEIYEAVLATYILLPTLLALINPKLGKFNVTDKGGLIHGAWFDSRIARPYIILLALNLIGLVVGVLRAMTAEGVALDTLLLNLGWCSYNLVVLGACLAVAREAEQHRRNHRIEKTIPGILRTSDEKVFHKVRTLDISRGGIRLSTPDRDRFPVGTAVQVVVDSRNAHWIDARVVSNTRNGELGLEFQDLDAESERAVVAAVFGQAHSWVHWRGARKKDDRPLRAVLTIMKVSLFGLSALVGWSVRSFFSREEKPSNQPDIEEEKMSANNLTHAPATIVVACTVCLLAMSTPAEGATSTAVPANSRSAAMPAATPTPAPTWPGIGAVDRTDLIPRERTISTTFADLGAAEGLRIRTVQGYATVPVNVRRDQVITKAEVVLDLSYSPSLRFDLSHLNVLLNDEPVQTIPLTADRASGAVVRLPIDPRLLLPNNRLTFEGILHYAPPNECEDPTHSTLWLHLGSRSTIRLEAEYLDLEYGFEDLPIPLFDRGDRRALFLPFAFEDTPGILGQQAAAVMASWFAAAADYRGATFPAIYGDLPPGMGVVFLVGRQEFQGVSGAQTTLSNNQASLITHPSDLAARLLVLWGKTEKDLLNLARGIAMGDAAISGNFATVDGVPTAPARTPWDSTRWVSYENGDFALFDSATSPTTVWGLTPEPVRFEFSLPPDLYALSDDAISVDLGYNVTPIAADRSSINVAFNREFFGGVGLNFEDGKALDQDATGSIDAIVAPGLVSARNRIDATFHLRRNTDRVCEDFDPYAMKGSVSPESYLKFGDVTHYAELPNLALLARGGYPYSRFGDLRETVLLMPQSPDESTLGAALTVVGHIARWSGEAATEIVVGTLGANSRWDDRDLIVVAGNQSDSLPAGLVDRAPIAFEGKRVKVRPVTRLNQLRGQLIGNDPDSAYAVADQVVIDANGDLGTLSQFESPWTQGRSVTLLTSGDSASPLAVSRSLTDPGRAGFIRGGLALENGENVSGYAIGEPYSAGKLPWWSRIKHWLQAHPYLMFALCILLALIAAMIIVRLLRAIAGRRSGE